MNATASDCSGGWTQGVDSAKGGRTAAARLGNGGVENEESQLGRKVGGAACRQGQVQGMAESRGGGLRKRRAQRAGGIHQAARIDAKLRVHAELTGPGTGKVAEFVIDSTLLRRQQQQQETERFVQVSHSVAIRPGKTSATPQRYQN